MPINVETEDVDASSLTGHTFCVLFASECGVVWCGALVALHRHRASETWHLIVIIT